MMAAAVFFGLLVLGYKLDHGLCKIAEAISRWRYDGVNVRLSLGHIDITQTVRDAAKGEG